MGSRTGATEIHEGDKMTSKDNMALWDKICVTDEKKTPTTFVNMRGGFTDIDAQSQCKWATELFGIYGVGWGLRKMVWGILTDGAGKTELTLDCEFFAVWGKEVIEFEISNDMEYKAGNECRKKLLTNTRSKALSLIGMNSDVYEGKFDSSRYNDKPSRTRTAPKPRKQTNDTGSRDGAPKKSSGGSGHPTEKQVKMMYAKAAKTIGAGDEFREWILRWTDRVDDPAELTYDEGQKLIEHLIELESEGNEG